MRNGGCGRGRIWELALMAALNACEEDTPRFSANPESGGICAGQCVADPAVHCVSDGPCADSRDCPSGTACLATGKNASEKRCQVPDQALKPTDTLLNGFGVDRLRVAPLRTEGSTAVAFEWDVPKHTALVSCALFSCLPEIGSARGARGIVNFDQCAVAWDVFPIDDERPVSVPFSLAEDVGNHHVPPREADGCTARQSTRLARQVTHLAVGCWAYDTTRLSYASKLLYVEPDSVGDYGGIPKDAACTEEFAPCYDATTRIFGTCLRGGCHERCMTDADCAPGDSGIGGEGGASGGAGGAGGAGSDNRDGHGGGPEGPRCEPVPNAPLGVCAPPELAAAADAGAAP